MTIVRIAASRSLAVLLLPGLRRLFLSAQKHGDMEAQLTVAAANGPANRGWAR